jgi:hypothetical protein
MTEIALAPPRVFAERLKSSVVFPMQAINGAQKNFQKSGNQFRYPRTNFCAHLMFRERSRKPRSESLALFYSLGDFP